MFSIFKYIKEKINNGIDSLAENLVMRSVRSDVSKASQVRQSEKVPVSSMTPKNKFAIAFANLASLAGLTRKDNFYRCEYDLQEIRNAIETDSYLKVAVQKYKQLFFKAGYAFKGKNDEALEYIEKRFRIMEWQTNQSMDLLFREIAGDLEAYSNAFLIKTRVDPKDIPFVKTQGITTNGKVVGGYFRVNPTSIQVQYTDKGILKAYKQKIPSGQEKIFKPEDVIHFTLDKEPGSIWGTPRLIAALEDVKLLRKMEANVLSLVYRFACPRYFAQVGLPQTGMEGTQKDLDDTKRMLERTPMDGIILGTERLKIGVIGSEGHALDLGPYLDYFERRVFTAINTSNAMMGRDSAKQDADSMEEQAHNIIKDDQQAFALQFKTAIINEILMEGGFNPIINKDDIVNFVFEEINLDTKVKLENHILNKFEKNALTFEEIRELLGLEKDDVDESRLYANMLTQANTLEQIDANAQNAMELAQFNADTQVQLARISAAAKPSASSSSSSSSKKGKSSYVKKNTGNGKTTKSTSRSKAVATNNQPQNQHGTYSARIKESLISNDFTDKINKLYDSMAPDISSHTGPPDLIISAYKAKITEIISNRIKETSMEGTTAAFKDIGKTIQSVNHVSSFESKGVNSYAKQTINDLFSEIEKRARNSDCRATLIDSLETVKYRITFLSDFIQKKSYWYSYMKTLAINGITQAEIRGNPDSKHNSKHEKVLDTNSFNINDIPGFSSGCECYIKPILKSRKVA